MPNYRCPYCQKTIRHKPEMAGDVVACSSCGGEYYEPTDPLPGMRPEKVPPPLPTSPSTPPKQQPPAAPASMPPANTPPPPGAGAAGPSPPDMGKPVSPGDTSAGALSDNDFDSMIQALSAEAVIPTEDSRPASQGNANPSHTPAPDSTPASPPEELDPVAMVAALESRGLSSILVSWPPAKPYAANMAFSAGLAREGANDMLLKIAFQIIKQRWPELGSMLTDYENQVN